MAMSKDLIKSVTCGICLDLLTEPRVLLTCLHTFCTKCLEKIECETTYSYSITCPLEECKEYTRRSARLLPRNMALEPILEVMKKSREDLKDKESEKTRVQGDGGSKCDMCRGENEVQECDHCDKEICSSCQKIHVRHIKDEIMCKVLQLGKEVEAMRESLTFDELLTKVRENRKTVKKDIDEAFTLAKSLLDKQRNDMVTKLNEFVDKEYQEIDTHKKNAVAGLSRMKDYCRSASLLLERHCDVMPIEDMTDIEDKCGELHDVLVSLDIPRDHNKCSLVWSSLLLKLRMEKLFTIAEGCEFTHGSLESFASLAPDPLDLSVYKSDKTSSEDEDVGEDDDTENVTEKQEKSNNTKIQAPGTKYRLMNGRMERTEPINNRSGSVCSEGKEENIKEDDDTEMGEWQIIKRRKKRRR